MTLLALDARRRVGWLALCAYLLSTTAWAAHYTGTYADADGAVVEIAHDAQGRFTGRLHTEQGTFVLSGHAADDRGGEGVIEAGTDRIPFDIALSADGGTLTLVLRANGARFTFRRQAHAASVGGSHHDAEQPRTEAQPRTETTDPYVGSYRDTQIAVVLEGGGGRYTGHIEANGQRYPVQLEASGQELVGAYQVGQDRFDVRIALRGETLVVRTGGATYHLARQPSGSAGSVASSADPAAVLESLHLRPVEIMDQTGFAQPVTALRLLVPQDFVFDLAQQGAADRAASSDRSQAGFSEAIRGTRQYFDPVANAPVELPDYYDFVWRLEDGSYRFTNDALIVPFRDWGIDGQTIERMP